MLCLEIFFTGTQISINWFHI